MIALRSKWLSKVVFHAIEINGQPGAIALLDGDIHSVTTFEIVDGYVITLNLFTALGIQKNWNDFMQLTAIVGINN